MLSDAKTPQDAQAGRALIVKACQDGLTSVCNDFGMYLWRHEPQNLSLRRKMGRIACDRGDAKGCEILGMVLYQTAQTSRDFKHASERLYRGCQKRLPLACSTLAEMLLKGQFGKYSPERARIFLTDACRQKFKPACARLKALEANPPKRRRP